ncbi:sugar nucleotide-binding protein [Deltaproteobacteria bacterium TL4]
MKVAVIGASSFIGSHLYLSLQNKYGRNQVVGTYFSNKRLDELWMLDVTDKNSVDQFLEATQPELLVLVAGNKNVRQCEENWDLACRLNVLPLNNFLISQSEHNRNSRILLFSSDYVFDGSQGYYTTQDIPLPATNYGRSKRAAELLFLNHPMEGTIIRTSAVMGRHGVFFDWLLHELQEAKTLELFTDAFFTPTPMGLLLDVTLALLEQSSDTKHEIIHIVGDKRFSRYDFAKYCQELLNNHATELIPIIRGDNSTIPYDLSMKASPYAQQKALLTFDEYIRKECP